MEKVRAVFGGKKNVHHLFPSFNQFGMYWPFLCLLSFRKFLQEEGVKARQENALKADERNKSVWEAGIGREKHLCVKTILSGWGSGRERVSLQSFQRKRQMF